MLVHARYIVAFFFCLSDFIVFALNVELVFESAKRKRFPRLG